jgi:hypothetical protein
MRRWWFAAAAAVFFECATCLAAAQQNAPAQQPAARNPTTITLSGCVQKSETAPHQFTLADGPAVYRLTGVDVRDFLGHRVEVVGRVPRKLKIAGGLKPSPNVAGQAGAMDAVRAAIATHDAASTSPTGPDLELRVRSIKPIGGSCGED